MHVKCSSSRETIQANIGSENDDATRLKIERLQLRNSLNVLLFKNSDLECSVKSYINDVNDWYTRYEKNVSEKYSFYKSLYVTNCVIIVLEII